MKEETAVLQVKGLTKHFPVAGHKVVHAVDDVSFSVSRGKTLGLVGESGCGKSTLAKMIAGSLPVSAGSITLNGVDYTRLSAREFRQFRRNI